MHRAFVVMFLMSAACAHSGTVHAQAFSEAQIRNIVSHGPWPQPWRPDPSNRVSGRPAAIELGRRLFFDARLSPSGEVSCSSCHRPERSWTDGRPRGIGVKPGKRNTPSLYDVRLNRWFGWSGGGDSLWMQSIRPILDPGEMGASAQHVQRYIGSHEELSGGYAGVFGRDAATADADTVLVDAAKALAAYQETIVSARTPFDVFRDTLAAGDEAAAARYPAAARRGLAVFIGKGGCNACHAGPAFTDGSFRTVGAGVKVRRAQSIADFLASPFNLAGPFNDDPKREVHWRADALSGERGVRVPTLRNIARTAPYMDDGAAATLRAAIRGHGNLGRTLTRDDVADLVRFLETLSEAGPLAK